MTVMDNVFKTPEIDTRFVDIGDLPTGFAPYAFDRLYVREFTISELKLLHQGMHSRVRPIEHTLRAVQQCVTVPVMELTDGDLEFVMTWLRIHSYPRAPLQVSWKCRQINVVDKKSRDFYKGPPLSDKDMQRRGLEHETCNVNNVNIVQKYGTSIHTLESDNLHITYEGVDFPRTSTLSDFFTWVDEDPEMRHILEVARWVKEGTTLKDKLEALCDSPDMELYENIDKCRREYKHGVEDSMELKCRECDYTWTHHSTPKLLSFYADNTEEDLFRIQYNLLSEFGHQYNPNMPAKLLLFNYSSLAKDRQDAAERRGGFSPLG